jgi:MoxR-like ATPase
MGYQTGAEETSIVARQSPPVPGPWRDQAVDLVRRTREHPDVRIGSSVRGALDMVRVAVSLARIRGDEPTAWTIGYDAALMGLSGRIAIDESSGRTAESVIEQLYTDVFGAKPEPGADQSPPEGENPGEA